MARGFIEFWVVATGQGSIRIEDGRRFAFQVADLVDVKPADLRRELAVEFVPRPDGTATRVRVQQAAGVITPLNLEIPPDLAPEHPAFRQPPVSPRLAELVSKCRAMHPGLRLDKYLAPVVKQESQKDRLSQVVGDASSRRAAACFRGCVRMPAGHARLARLGAVVPHDLWSADAPPGQGFDAGKRRHLPPSDPGISLPAGYRAKGHGTGLRRDSLVADPGE